VLAELAPAAAAIEVDGSEGIDLLVRLDADDRAALAPLLVTEHYAAGEHILREGEPADRLCLLVEGRASGLVRVGQGDDAHDRRVRTFGPGTLFGEAAVLEGGQRPTDVVADDACTVLSLGREALAGLETTRPEVYAHLVAGLARSLSELLHQAVDELRVLGD
jgi:glutaminase